MSWRITFPRADGTTMDLYRLKFVASGTTPPRLEGPVAVSVTQDRTGHTWQGEVVYLGGMAHGGVRTWTALFNLQGLQHRSGDTFTISLYHENPQGVWILHHPQRTGIQFNLRREVDPQGGGVRPEFYHTIFYPSLNADLSATAVSAYGMVAPGETVAADGGTLNYNGEVSDGGGTRPDGFWWVTFNAFPPPSAARYTDLTVTLASGTTGPQTRTFRLNA